VVQLFYLEWMMGMSETQTAGTCGGCHPTRRTIGSTPTQRSRI